MEFSILVIHHIFRTGVFQILERVVDTYLYDIVLIVPYDSVISATEHHRQNVRLEDLFLSSI